MGNIIKIEFLLYGLILNVGYILTYDPATCVRCRESHICNPPACFCCRDTMPLGTNNIPQMVFFSFDDAVNPPVANFYRELFDSKRLNPNGCPVSLTLFVSHSNTLYSLVQEFYQKGFEIASHSVTHAHMNPVLLREEAMKQKENIAKNGKIPIDQITGWRSPFLEPVGDLQPSILKDLGYEYDATLTFTKKNENDTAITPFTLDFGWPYDCKIKSCPNQAHKGFWEVPVVSVKDYKNKYDCVYVDGCNIPPPSENLAFKFLWDNFQRYYTTNRAPMGVNMHASWFYYPDRKRAMDRFIKELVKLDDVYIVSIKQVIEWLKDPTPLNQLHSFQPWSCSSVNATKTTSQTKPSSLSNRFITKAPAAASESIQWNRRRSRTSRPVVPSDELSRPPLVPNLPMIQFWWHRPGGQMQRRVDRERNLRQQEEQRQEKRRRQRAEEERLRKLELQKQAEAKRLEQQRQERLRKQELARQAEIKRKTELEKKQIQAKRLEDLKKKQLEKQKQQEIEEQKLKKQQVIAATKVESFRQQQSQKENQKMPVIPQADNRFFPQQRSSRTMGLFMGMHNRGSRFSQPAVDNRLSTNVRETLQRKQYLQNELPTRNRDISVVPKPTTAQVDTANVLENSFDLFISRKLDEILKYPASKRTIHLEQMSLPELRALQSELSSRLVTKRRPDSSASTRYITQTPDISKTSMRAHNSPVLREFHDSNDVVKTKLPEQEAVWQLETKKSEMFGVPKPLLKEKIVQQIVLTTPRPVLTDATSTTPTTTTTTAQTTTTTTMVPTTTQTMTTVTQKPTTTQPTTTAAPTTTTTTVTTTTTEAPITAAPTTTKLTTVATTTEDVPIHANPTWLINEAGMQSGQLPWHKWITKAPAFSMATSSTTKHTTQSVTPSAVKLFSINGFNLGSALTFPKPDPKPIFRNENDIKDHVSIWKYTDSSTNINNALIGVSEVSIDNAVPSPTQTNIQATSNRMPDITINDNKNRMPDLSVNLDTSFSNLPRRAIPLTSLTLDAIGSWAIAPESQIASSSNNSITIASIDPTTTTTTTVPTTTTKPTTTSSTTTPTTTSTTVPTTTKMTTTITTTPAETTRATTKLTTKRVTPTPFRVKFDEIRKKSKVNNRSEQIIKSFVIPRLSSTRSSKTQYSPKTSKVVHPSSPSWFNNSSRSKPTTHLDKVCKQEVNCLRPNCVCSSHSAPTTLKTEDVPQIVYITVDGSLNFHTFGKLQSLFSKTRLNPNGCRIKGTVFVTDTGSSYRIANVLKSDGLELALMGMSSRPYRSALKLKRDIETQRKRVANEANILPSDIKGWRSPGFAPVGDEQYNILGNKSLYDSSLLLAARAKDDPILWPHTLDFGWRKVCQMGKCPRQRHSAVWEVPILPYVGPNNSAACEYTDGCVRQPLSEEETLSYLRENFNLHYRNGKAPFAIRLKQIWFHWYYRANFSALLKFLDEILNQNDVYITSVSDMVEWMKSPVPLKQIQQFEPWQC